MLLCLLRRKELNMNDLSKKVSYLSGYADGLNLSPKSDEGKLIGKMLEVMEEMADRIEELEAIQDDAMDMIDEIDEELLVIADDLYGDGEWDDEDDDYDDDEDDSWLDEDDEDGMDSLDDDLFEIQCPNCGEDVMVDFDMLDSSNEIVCPNCHEEIELEFDFEDEDDEDDNNK